MAKVALRDKLYFTPFLLQCIHLSSLCPIFIPIWVYSIVARGSVGDCHLETVPCGAGDEKGWGRRDHDQSWLLEFFQRVTTIIAHGPSN